MTGPIPLIDAELLRGVLAELPLATELDPTAAFVEDDVIDTIIEGADITPEDVPEVTELGITPEDILDAIGLDIEPIDENGDGTDAMEDSAAPPEAEGLALLDKRPDTVLNRTPEAPEEAEEDITPVPLFTRGST